MQGRGVSRQFTVVFLAMLTRAIRANELFCKSALTGDGGNVTRAMQYTDDDNLVVERKIIDRILFMEEHAQIICEVVTRRAGEWKLQCLIESNSNASKKVCGE